MLACATSSAAIVFSGVALCLMALFPVSLGALSAVSRRPGRDARALWVIGALALVAGLLELAFGLLWLPAGVLGVLQVPVGALVLARNDGSRRSERAVTTL